MKRIIASVLFLIYLSFISGFELEEYGITLFNSTDELYENIEQKNDTSILLNKDEIKFLLPYYSKIEWA